MNVDTLTYALADEQHYQGILKLWKEHSNWGNVSLEQLKNWLEAPYEPAFITIATDKHGEVLGQCFVTPSRLNTPKGEIKAARISAPIIREDLKGGNLLDPNHAINQLFQFSFKQAMRHGIEVVYMYPFAAWVRVLKIAHNYGFPKFLIKSFAITQASLSLESNANLVARFSESYTQKHEKVWGDFVSSKPVFAINHSVKWLTYKANDFVKVEVLDSDKCVGLLIYNTTKNLVYDLFAISEALLPQVTGTAANFLKIQGMTAKPIIKFLGTEALVDAFGHFEISPLEYQHVFAIASLGPNYSFDDFENGKWYLTSLE